MGSRDKDQTTPHPPLLSSLVVRPTDSGGGGGGGVAGGAGSDYEPGEVRRDPPPFSRSDRYHDNHGYRIHAGSASPVRHRNSDHHFSPDFDHSGGPQRNRGFGTGRDPGRYRDLSPPYGRARDSGRPIGSVLDGHGFGPVPLRGDGIPRNNPNVRPRDGDWVCPDPMCSNLNFARREYCNNCNRSRPPPSLGSPRRNFPGAPPPPPRRFLGPPVDRSPGRPMNGYRSPPRSWARDGPRDFGLGGPPNLRHEMRLPDHYIRRDRPDYPEDDYRERSRFDRSMAPDLGYRDRGRENFFNDRKGYERRVPSPPLPPPLPARGRFARDLRERSRSPVRDLPPPKDYRRGSMYMERGRDDRRGVGRDRIADAY